MICVRSDACSRVGCLLESVSGVEGAADRLHHGQAAARVAAFGRLSQSRHTRHLKHREKTSQLSSFRLVFFSFPHSNEPLMERAGVFCCCSALDYFSQQQRQLLVRRSLWRAGRRHSANESGACSAYGHVSLSLDVFLPLLLLPLPAARSIRRRLGLWRRRRQRAQRDIELGKRRAQAFYCVAFARRFSSSR